MPQVFPQFGRKVLVGCHRSCGPHRSEKSCEDRAILARAGFVSFIVGRALTASLRRTVQWRSQSETGMRAYRAKIPPTLFLELSSPRLGAPMHQGSARCRRRALLPALWLDLNAHRA